MEMETYNYELIIDSFFSFLVIFGEESVNTSPHLTRTVHNQDNPLKQQ